MDDWLDLQAQVSAIASEAVMVALEHLQRVSEKFWYLSHKLTGEKDAGEDLAQGGMDALERLASEARTARDDLAETMRKDLSGVAR